MTCPWPISSNLRFVFAALLAAAAVQAATVSGSVQFASKGQSASNGKNTPARPAAGVVVWLDPAKPDASRPDSAPPIRVRMEQVNKSFRPHVLAIPAGSTVDFPNLDRIFHNAFSNFDGKVFDIGLYGPQTNRAVRFDRPGIVRIFCNIHPQMSAVIAVLSTPHFAITKPDGSFQIDGVLPGAYQLRAFSDLAAPTADPARALTVGTGPLALPAIALPPIQEPPPRRNKYGLPYGVPPSTTDPYSRP